MQPSTTVFSLLLAIFFIAAHPAPAVAADGDRYLGTWIGTWAGGDASGHFELTLGRSAEGKVTGSIAVSQDGGANSDYTAKLKSAEFTGDKFSAAYEPPDGQSQINLKGSFTARAADGDWSLGAKDQPTSPPMAAGTWKITKE
jgi:hypothetical protein